MASRRGDGGRAGAWGADPGLLRHGTHTMDEYRENGRKSVHLPSLLVH